jgi:multiple sugar transport system substrate-binding protein
MRQLFWDGGAFSVFHTSSLYDTYVQKAKGFEVGMSWLPGGRDGRSFKSEVGGSVILIPAVASQKQKNAAWQFMMFMASPEMNLFWADKTGYFPTRQKATQMSGYDKYLERKPAMKNIVSMGKWINPRNQHPAYDTVATEWRHALAKIFNEGAPVKATLDALAKNIQETLDDN